MLNARLVTNLPTPEMIEAGTQALAGGEGAASIFIAMLEAAPLLGKEPTPFMYMDGETDVVYGQTFGADSRPLIRHSPEAEDEIAKWKECAREKHLEAIKWAGMHQELSERLQAIESHLE